MKWRTLLIRRTLRIRWRGWAWNISSIPRGILPYSRFIRARYRKNGVPETARREIFWGFDRQRPGQRHPCFVRIDEWEETRLPLTPQPQDRASLYKNVAAALEGKEELVVTPESVLRCFKVIEAARISAESGKSVEF